MNKIRDVYMPDYDEDYDGGNDGIYDTGEDDLDASDCCWECGREAITYCGCCGVPLCIMCSEMGAGFCGRKHSKEEWTKYAKTLRGEPK